MLSRARSQLLSNINSGTYKEHPFYGAGIEVRYFTFQNLNPARLPLMILGQRDKGLSNIVKGYLVHLMQGMSTT